MSGIFRYLKTWFDTPEEAKVTYSDTSQLIRKPQWKRQTLADLDRHEGFRPYAYPDPLSVIGKRYPAHRYGWGYEPATIILARLGLNEVQGRPWTYGHGFTKGVTPASSITKEKSYQMLEPILDEHLKVLDAIFTTRWKEYPDYVKSVLANMAFNMGYRFAKFHQTIEFIKDGKYAAAGFNLKRTLWYKQVGVRSEELVERLITGKVQDQYKID